MSDLVIETNNLTKQYGEQKSVANLSIHVKKGRIYGLLGRNGAGKTTTMKMLLGLTSPTSGEVRIFGRNMRTNDKKILSRIGNLIESPGFYPNLTGTENPKIGRDRAHLLSGILKCPKCGGPMYTNKHAWTNKDGTYKEIYYYMCSKARTAR